MTILYTSHHNQTSCFVKKTYLLLPIFLRFVIFFSPPMVFLTLIFHPYGIDKSRAQDGQIIQKKDSSIIRSEIERQITPFLHPFITTDAYRDVNEDILKKGQSLEIWRLDNLETGLIENKLCQSVRHLLFGRLNRSLGIQELFKKMPQIEDVHWILYRIKTEVTPNLNNQYQQTRQPVRVAKISVSRKKALLFDPVRLKKMLKGQACTTTAKLFIDEVWLSDRVKIRRARINKLNLEKKSLQQTKLNQRRAGSRKSE